MSYKNWRDRQEGKVVVTYLQPTLEDEGYYRKPITEMVIGRNGKPNGQRKTVDWIPVAYFISDYDQRLTGLIGAGEAMRDMSPEEIGSEELWSWVCRNTISYELYDAVANNGEPWPDLAKTDNVPVVKTLRDYADQIHAMVAVAPTKIVTKEDVEAAGGVKNRIAELRLEADKAGKAIYQPLYAAYTKEQKAWAPMVAEAKAAEDRIDRLIRQWSEAERVRLEKEAAEIERARQEEEERNQRAADRALIRGEEPPVPETETPEAPSTTVVPIAPDYGKRVVKPELKAFVTITEEHKVYNYFMGEPELTAVLQKLAERAVKLGNEVPGTTVRKGYA